MSDLSTLSTPVSNKLLSSAEKAITFVKDAAYKDSALVTNVRKGAMKAATFIQDLEDKFQIDIVDQEALLGSNTNTVSLETVQNEFILNTNKLTNALTNATAFQATPENTELLQQIKLEIEILTKLMPNAKRVSHSLVGQFIGSAVVTGLFGWAVKRSQNLLFTGGAIILTAISALLTIALVVKMILALRSPIGQFAAMLDVALTEVGFKDLATEAAEKVQKTAQQTKDAIDANINNTNTAGNSNNQDASQTPENTWQNGL
jgi:hypothetical protein